MSQFVKELNEALTKDMAEIHETELDSVGVYKKADLEIAAVGFHSVGATSVVNQEVLVDKLGRLILPYNSKLLSLKRVKFEDEFQYRKVVKTELRYVGETPNSVVVYIESKGAANAGMD